jgi:hypothetical protein
VSAQLRPAHGPSRRCTQFQNIVHSNVTGERYSRRVFFRILPAAA